MRGEDSDGLKYRRDMDYIKIQAGVDVMSEPQEKSVEKGLLECERKESGE